MNSMRDRLIKLLCGVKCEGGEEIGNCPQRRDGQCRTVQKLEMCQIGAITDHLLANDVIVPPYRCGTVVYVVRSQTSNGKNLYMRKERIDHYRTFNNGTFMIFESGRISVRDDQWGRCVFATPEEAEQALKGGESHD